MGKLILSAMAGAFAGAFVMEMINRKNPDAVRGAGRKTKKAFSDFGQAFMDGYRGSDTQPVPDQSDTGAP